MISAAGQPDTREMLRTQGPGGLSFTRLGRSISMNHSSSKIPPYPHAVHEARCKCNC